VQDDAAYPACALKIAITQQCVRRGISGRHVAMAWTGCLKHRAIDFATGVIRDAGRSSPASERKGA